MNALTPIRRAFTPLSKPPVKLLDREPHVDHYADPTDITDVWTDEVDPSGEAEVFAYFDRNGGDCMSLKGLSVKEGSTTLFYSLAGARDFLSEETIARIETVEGDT